MLSLLKREPKEARRTDEPESDALKLLRETSGKDDPYLYAMRAAAYTQILAVHGLQSHVFSMGLGQVIDLLDDEDDDLVWTQFNVILPVIELQKALILSSPPERQTVPQTRNEWDIEAAQYAADMMDWSYEELNIAEKAVEAADLYVKTGDFIHFVGWDPSGGRFFMGPDGQMIFEGEPVWRIDSKFQWSYHPQARNYRESPYAKRESTIPRQWVFEHFPEKARDLPDDEGIFVSDGQMFERSLLNLSPSHGITLGGVSAKAPQGESFLELHELYVRSSPKYPEGRMILALARGGDPYLILHDGPNPYIEWKSGKRTLPVVHAKMLSVPGRLWGESYVPHMLPHQAAINRLLTQIYSNAELVGNPQGYYFGGSMNPDQWTNRIGGLMELLPGTGAPGYIQPPPLPQHIFDGLTIALQTLDGMVRPAGPLEDENQRKVTSGVHQMILNQAKEMRIEPMLRPWEQSWDAAWKLYVDNWRTFATLPKKIGVVGEDDGWRETYFSSEQARANFVVKVRARSTMPTDRVATFAEWIELIKSGAAPVQTDPGLQRQMWDDLGKGHMARSYRDNEVGVEKARRNIQKVRVGGWAVFQPQDEPNVGIHLSVYENWMQTREYEQAVLRDAELEMRMNVLRDSFRQAKAIQDMAAMTQMMFLSGKAALPTLGGEGEKNPQQEAAKTFRPGKAMGDGGVARGTQTAGAPNPFQGAEGNPAGPQPVA